jgi:zinc protease
MARHEFDRLMEKHGGSNNAYTTRDLTVYSDWFSRSALELVLSMEAERLRNLTFDPTMVESERKVVLSERLTTVENDPFGYLEEELYAALYQKHPYRWPVLGWASDIRSWTVSDLRDHVQRGYAPNNCVLVAVGDVTADAFLSQVDKRFASLPQRALPPPVGTAEPEQYHERRVDLERHVQTSQQLIAFRVPPTADADYRPLQLASAILTSGHSSRLYARLVRHDRLAESVSSWLRLSLDPGELLVHVTLRHHADLARVDRAIDEEMERLRSSPVPSRELRAAKNKLLTEHALSIRTDSGMADWLGTYEVFFGDCHKLFSAPQAIERVTAEDVQRVAIKYLVSSNRTIATLKPAAASPKRGPVQ